jgi:prepilin-type N-terminal cleavage/methylation domain-containing protein
MKTSHDTQGIRGARAGMTLVELLVALTIFGIVIATSIAFMAQQNTAFQNGVHRLVTLRNLRYAVATMSQDLETLGTNVPNAQPALFYADDDVVAFSSDYATNLAGVQFAVFYDPDAPSGQVSAPSGGFSIPNSSVSIPDTTYESAPGIRSPAEVLIFFVVADTGTARTDDFLLMRQVNNNTPEVIARNLLQVGTDPFFTYAYLSDDGGGNLELVAVPDSLVPIRHTAPIHLSTADTAGSARADSVRAIRVRFGATNGLTGEEEEQAELERLIAFPNAGFGQLVTCGSSPLLGTVLLAVPGTVPTGEPAVDLAWSTAVDEGGGEDDVVGYVIWRREAGTSDWGEPYLSIPAGTAPYTYQDAAVESGTTYEYALAAQDCTPSLSGIAVSATVTPS